MDFVIVNDPALGDEDRSPLTLEEFVSSLRRFTQVSVIASGCAAMWEPYRAKVKPLLNNESVLINAFGDKVVLLALAVCNNSRLLELKQFASICSEYLGISGTISDKEFLDNEAISIAEYLISDKSIPEKYVSSKLLREIGFIFFLGRHFSEQSHAHLNSLKELLTDYSILNFFDANNSDSATQILEKTFGMDPVRVIRAGVGLFSVSMSPDKNGLIDLDTLKIEDDVTKILKIDLENCRQLAFGISYKHTDLFEKWYKKDVLTLPVLYQRHALTPLYMHPLIHLDKNPSSAKFLIPSPALFLRGLRQALFSKLFRFKQPGLDTGDALGKAIENHIEKALRSIFGTSKVSRISNSKKHADFLVSLTKIDLVFETKAQMGSLTENATMSPKHISSLWGRLYSACLQCSESKKEHQKTGRKLICVVLIADHISGEYWPFEAYANECGIYKDLNLEGVEYLSWNAFERRLAQTSIASLEDALIAKWENANPIPMGSWVTLQSRVEPPAHSYEYLKDLENEIFRP